MKKAMTVTYEVEGALYVNVTNRCTNRCDFCIRNNGDGAYGSDSLWLERDPSLDELLASVFARELTEYRELVFCGYGEPSYRINECHTVALAVKEKYPDLPVRINTNGHSDLIHGTETSHLYKDAFDVVSVSLNTPSAEKYASLCHPVYGGAAFYGLIEFTKKVKDFVPTVMLSVVRETLSDEELSACYRIAEECGVSLKVRTYIPPSEDN